MYNVKITSLTASNDPLLTYQGFLIVFTLRKLESAEYAYHETLESLKYPLDRKGPLFILLLPRPDDRQRLVREDSDQPLPIIWSRQMESLIYLLIYRRLFSAEICRSNINKGAIRFQNWKMTFACLNVFSLIMVIKERHYPFVSHNY